MNENSIIKDIGRSYIVSSFIPSALFVGFGALVYRDFFPWLFKSRFQNTEWFLGGQILLATIFVVWIGFALYSLSDFTIQFFEGYKFPDWVQKKLKQRHLKLWAKKINKSSIQRYSELLNKEDRTAKEINELIGLRGRVKAEIFEFEMDYPVHETYVKSTRLANVMTAFENYPGDRYYFNGLAIFPRLIHLLPQKIKEQIEEQNNKLVFLLNSSLLSLINGLIGILIFLFGTLFWMFSKISYPVTIPYFGYSFIQYFQYLTSTEASPQNFIQNGFTQISPLKYFLISLVFLGCAYLLYRVAVTTARTYGLVIRATFDMHRFDLLKQLNQSLPEDNEMERTSWDGLTELMMAGNLLGNEDIYVKYNHSTSKKVSKKKKKG